MGAGIAQVCAQAGFDVKLNDRERTILRSWYCKQLRKTYLVMWKKDA